MAGKRVSFREIIVVVVVVLSRLMLFCGGLFVRRVWYSQFEWRKLDTTVDRPQKTDGLPSNCTFIFNINKYRR